MKPGSTLL